MMEQVAGRTRAVIALMRQLAGARNNPQNNRVGIDQLVSSINALMIPKAWVGLDDDRQIHVTYYVKSNGALTGLQPGDLTWTGSSSVPMGPSSMNYLADYVWHYDQAEGTVTCMKSRSGRWCGETLKCENPATVVVD